MGEKGTTVMTFNNKSKMKIIKNGPWSTRKNLTLKSNSLRKSWRQVVMDLMK